VDVVTHFLPAKVCMVPLVMQVPQVLQVSLFADSYVVMQWPLFQLGSGNVIFLARPNCSDALSFFKVHLVALNFCLIHKFC
jgi:hypothetical protein